MNYEQDTYLALDDYDQSKIAQIYRIAKEPDASFSGLVFSDGIGDSGNIDIQSQIKVICEGEQLHRNNLVKFCQFEICVPVDSPAEAAYYLEIDENRPEEWDKVKLKKLQIEYEKEIKNNEEY